MPIFSAAQLAKQARTGVARSGAEVCGYFGYVNVFITINGVDQSNNVMRNTLTISQAINDQPDTARFTMKPGATIPTPGYQIAIGLGDSSHYIFAGQVARVSHIRREGQTQTPFVQVECVDFSLLFDRLLLTATYTSESATAIAQSIIATTGSFFSVNVASGLPTIDYFPLTNEKPSAALRRLVNLMGGGGFYYDPYQDVHVFPSTGETGIGAPTNPQTLTNSLASLKSFTHHYDFSQVRNRVIFEGARTRSLIDVPVGTTDGIPIEDGSRLHAAGGTLRTGTQILAYSSVSSITNNPTGSTVSSDAAAGDTVLHVADQTQFPAAGWAKVGDQVIRYHTLGVSFLQDIPASGYGSLAQAIKTGTPVAAVASFFLTDATTDTIAAGDELIERVTVDNTTSQTAIAAIEGGNGIHEHFLSDGRVTYDGAVARATQEATQFGDAILSIEYVSDDMNVVVGAQQAVNLTVTDTLSDTLTITSVDLTFAAPNRRPLRRATAAAVPLAQFADIAQTETM
jgi:hypothetical protein